MSQDGKVEPSSDYETSDVNTNSLNNSLSEEEFSIVESSDIDRGGLKLTISCRKKSCDDEVDYSSRTNLNKVVNEDTHMNKDKLSEMEKQVLQCDTEDGEIHSLTKGVPDPEKDTPESGITHTEATSTVCSESPQPPPFATPSASICKSAKTALNKSSPPSESQDRVSSVMSCETGSSRGEGIPAGQDVAKGSESIKPHKRYKQTGSTTCSNDIQEPLLRLDTLPNVSPDSGIISLDESPFGNESPSSLVNGELTSDSNVLSQTICNMSGQAVSKRMEGMVSASASSDQTISHIGVSDGVQSTSITGPSQRAEVSNSGTELVETYTSDAERKDVCDNEVVSNQTAEEKPSSPKENCGLDGGETEDTNTVKEMALPQSPHPPNGNKVILSSPHKISQATGRKKRGRPPKKKKSLLLKHKKSTLYSGLYGDVIVTDSEIKNSAISSEKSKGSIDDSLNITGAKQTTTNSANGAKVTGGEATNKDCDTAVVKKRPGRPKGSVSKNKFTKVVQRRVRDKSLNARTPKLHKTTGATSATQKARTPILHKMGGAKACSTASQPSEVKVKRPRGRPRKNPLPPCIPSVNKPDVTVPADKTSSNNSVEPLSAASVKTKPSGHKIIKKKIVRKRVFTQKKRKTYGVPKSTGNVMKVKKSSAEYSNLGNQSSITASQSRNQSKASTASVTEKAKKEMGTNKLKSPGCAEKSVFQDNDLDALLKSVKSSISSQFANEDANSDILSFDNPFKAVQPPSFPKMLKTESPGIVKPKAKKPKLHVMMRRNKRKKRKKFQTAKSGAPSAASLSPRKLSVFTTVAPQKRMGKFSVSPQKKAGTFGSPTSEKRLSFFTSRVQPSKILASSRLNVFRSGTGVDGPHRSGTPTDTDQPDCTDKRGKKRHRLLYRKSKHKNIIDPVFAADLDTLVSGLLGLAIAENPADNYIRVRPGEMPLPSIFRVPRIDVNKKGKDKMFMPEPYGLEKARPLKPRKETPSPNEVSPVAFKPVLKAGRKKSSSDQGVDNREHSSVSDSSDQCLPPKKRHRLVHMEASQSSSPVPVSGGETSFLKSPPLKRRGRRPKKFSGTEENKTDDKDNTIAPGKLGQQYVGQVLTIDTSSYTTGGSSICTPSLSPCPSRQSTRSSTQPSLSSPSPTGSTGFRSRLASKSSFALSCPIHAMSSCLSDKSSCAECQLLEQSLSPGTLRSGRTTLRSFSVQASESSSSSERPLSSSEPSPTAKDISQPDRLQGRSVRKRRKSSNMSTNDSDSSPPRLEKNSSLSPNAYHDSSIFSEPPEITSSPFKLHVSPRRQSQTRAPHLTVDSPVNPSPRKKMCSNASPQRNLRRPSPNKSASKTPPATRMCNKSSSSPQSSSKSVIQHPCSEHEPLPLEHCSKRKLVEEIKAAISWDSDDGSTCSDENIDDQNEPVPSTSNGTSLGQPPRKRFQRVGLFSDFYKDEEPRKRCENMVKCRDKLVYVKDEHEFGLIPQPLHIGQYYMRQVQDFQLPYDIWWQHSHQQLPKKTEPKIKFRNIRTNVYSDSKVSSRKIEIPLCNCTPKNDGGKSCGDDCLNRMIYTECCPSTCPAGENCDNQKIQKHEWAPGIEKFLTKDRGFGVRTRNFIKSGQFILEYLGEVISETEFRRRMMEEYSEECHHYALHLDSGSLIDGYRMGNVGRYVNHSCQPNCEMQKWNVNGLYRMVLFALRDIEPGEELSYDYNFDSFNQETQQECRCGSSECRGVIGVKTQRSNSTSKFPEKMDDCKDKRKSKLMNKKMKEKPSDPVPVQPMAKPMTFKERCYARKHRTFLVRNVDKVRNQRSPTQDYAAITKEELNVLDCSKINAQNSDLMLAHLNERSIKTRLAAYAKDSPEMARRHQLAQILDKMLTELLSLKDEDGNNLVAPLMSLPSRKKQPQYYQVIRDPIDLSMIKQRVKTGYYEHLSSFNSDLMQLFSNVELYCGPKSDMGQVILKLRRVLNCVKTDVAPQIDELLGPNTTKGYMDSELERLEQVSCRGPDEPEEDIIRCICGVTRDEGLMLQCEKCLRWQHCDCVRASGKEEHYLCDRCEPRYYDPEILLVPPPPDALPDCTHYMTVVKDDVQYAVGDCVYVMRDCKRTSTGTPLRSSHRLMASVNPDKLDVFRLEQLWKDPKGERFASGTPYLRPQETFHEPTRKFYHNELFRTPNFEIIPMDLVMGKCVVMDPNTYVKGRPKGFKEQDVYICEYRVDKTAHLFHKIQKIWYPINTGRFCFDWFENKLTIRRTFAPHEVPEEYKRKAERNMAAAPSVKAEMVKPERKYDVKKGPKNHSVTHGKVRVDDSIKNDLKLKAEVKVNVKKGGVAKKEGDRNHTNNKIDLQKMRENKKKEQKHRLDKILTRLLNNLPGKQKVDLTYLLDDGKRIRKKVTK